MIVTNDYAYHSWKVESPWLDEPIHISFFKDYDVEILKVKQMIRDKKLKQIIK